MEAFTSVALDELPLWRFKSRENLNFEKFVTEREMANLWQDNSNLANKATK